MRAFVEDNVRRFNGAAGDPPSFDLLDGLLAEQAYRVAYWRVAGEEINYRRFFDINELAAIRMEVPAVFDEAHALVFRLVGEGSVTGLRVDHPDGLYAPAEYFQRLQAGCARALGGAAGDFYVVAEKILAPGEHLPDGWATAGTTGYEFLNLVNGIFVDRSQARAMEQVYARLIRLRPPFGEIVDECKRLVMETSMASELNMLGHRLDQISEKHRSSRDFTLGSLTTVLREIIAAFPVYRTYAGERVGDGDEADRRGTDSDGVPTVSQKDREYIARAVAVARRRTPTMSALVYDWVQDVLTLRFPEWATPADRAERLDFVRRFQQITGPVTAKGYEDTVLYRFNRLVSLNEVGGDPSRFGASIAEFHAANAERRLRSPHALSATATHDTKRGEDVRARINVLSEIPIEWRARVGAWQRLNRKLRETVDGAPDPGREHRVPHLSDARSAPGPSTPSGCAPTCSRPRARPSRTPRWINPNARYDETLARFVDAILDPARSSRFLDDFTTFQARIAHFGALNSLAQTLVKITAPGVPDFYQGTELWDLSLVDPDNRRPVDWGQRRRLLAELQAAIVAAADRAALAQELVKTREDGRVKMFLIREALALRARRRALFERGDYRPLEVHGAWAEHVCAFARVARGWRRAHGHPPAARPARAGYAAAWARLLGRHLARAAPPIWPAGTPTCSPASRCRPPRPAPVGLPLGAVLAAFPVALLDHHARMSDAVGRAPFQFIGCVELRQALDHRATDERELLERLEDAPAGSVFYHTHGYFLRHRPITTAYGNDFAAWVAVHVRDQVLAERLAVINPFESATVEDLREELVSVIHDHLLRLPSVPRVEFGEPFHFQQSHIVEVPLGAGVSTLAEFRAGLAAVDASAIYFHMVEARTRLGRRSGDFAEWLRTSLDMPQLAERIERIDAYMTSLERVRARVLSLVDAAIEGAEGGVGTGPA